MTRHPSCPSCTCGTPIVVIDPTAPGYELVLEVDDIWHADMIARRTATRKAAK